jgi:TonB family protein
MTILLDAQETVDRFGVYIQELRAILKANNLKFGSPDNFFAFAQRLQSDDLLRTDLSRMVKFFIERNNSKVSLRTILTIIAIASGGSGLADTNRDLSKPMNLVLDFLIRSGNCSLIDQEHMDTDLDENSVSDKVRSPSPLELLAQDTPGGQTYTSTDLLQSLNRLEFTTLQARQYLDSIEQRINRMEPRLENLPSQASPPPNQSPAETEPSDVPLPDFVRRVSTQSRERMAWFFLLGEKFAVVPVLATIAGGTLLYIGYPRNSAKTDIRSDIPRPTATIVIPSTTAGPTSFVPSTDEQTDATTEDTITPPKPPAGHPAAALDAPTIKNNPGRTPKAPEHAANHVAFRSVVSTNVEAAEVPSAERSTETVAKVRRDAGHTLARVSAKPVPSSLRMIDVSSGVMAANLVSASAPSYPKLASLTHMQGKVVMQAIISKDGTVQNLQVIQGHHLLRGAAKNAVRTWQYHPYLINGKPVEVATIVSVDFTLGH